jgi:hypothetical protein
MIEIVLLKISYKKPAYILKNQPENLTHVIENYILNSFTVEG